MSTEWLVFDEVDDTYLVRDSGGEWDFTTDRERAERFPSHEAARMACHDNSLEGVEYRLITAPYQRRSP